jgi:hypothetical protein
MSSISREKARVYGSRAQELNVNTGSDSATTIVIGKMFGEEIEVTNGTVVLRSSPGRRDRTSVEIETIETAEMGNAPTAGDRIVIDPIASGSPALLVRPYRAIAIGTIGTGEIGKGPIAGIRIGAGQIVRGDPTHPVRKYRATEPATSAVEKTGSVIIGTLRIGTGQIVSDGPEPHGRKDGRMIKVSSAPNAERAGAIAMKANELP